MLGAGALMALQLLTLALLSSSSSPDLAGWPRAAAPRAPPRGRRSPRGGACPVTACVLAAAAVAASLGLYADSLAQVMAGAHGVGGVGSRAMSGEGLPWTVSAGGERPPLLSTLGCGGLQLALFLSLSCIAPCDDRPACGDGGARPSESHPACTACTACTRLHALAASPSRKPPPPRATPRSPLLLGSLGVLVFGITLLFSCEALHANLR